jgi:dual specificity tyrosine-phosphorylation-regulated kinase 2/3/4
MPTVQTIARETAESLRWVHSGSVIHCDIQPENLVFTSKRRNHIKLIDFGCSCYVGKIMFSYIQSRYYRAPEVVLGLEYGREIDIWSLGCVICEMLTGIPLFSAEDETELISMIVELRGLPPPSLVKMSPRAHHYFDREGNFRQKPNSKGKVYVPGAHSVKQATNISDPLFIDLIESCLTWTASERITADEFLKHPWITQTMRPIEVAAPKSAR